MRRILILGVLLLLAAGVFAQESTEDPLPFDDENSLPPGVEMTDEPTPIPTATPTAIESPTPTTEDTPEITTPIIVETQPPTAAPSGDTYIVQRGDTLFRIARRFNTSVTALAAANGVANPSLILVGQSLVIPSGGVAPSPTDTPPPTEEGYTVQRGDSLYKIAARFNTTVAELIRLNNLANPNIIIPGQVLAISQSEPFREPQAINANFAPGIIVYFADQDTAALIDLVEELGMTWVKVRVDWRTLESVEGQADYDQLDPIVEALDEAGLNILLTITNAPAWARSTDEENGPPDDLTDYSTFVNALAERYQGVVDAYQIWDEPNLRRNWNCNRRMCDTDYVEMLRLAYDAVKIADEDAIVVTAGLAPTRFNDRINAIDDRLYLETLYANGIATISDAIGVHPAGAANPPDSRCCEKSAGVESHFDNESFYFLDNLENVRQIMLRYSDGATPIWITKFGWGTGEDTDPPNELNSYVTYTSLEEQAIYVPRAFELAAELDYVGTTFLNNLNGCQGLPTRAEACYPALIDPSGTPRLVFETTMLGFSDNR